MNGDGEVSQVLCVSIRTQNSWWFKLKTKNQKQSIQYFCCTFLGLMKNETLLWTSDKRSWWFETILQTRTMYREKRLKRNFYSSPSSLPVGCPGFCWLIDSVWPFVMLWKSIDKKDISFLLVFSSQIISFLSHFVERANEQTKTN